MLSMYRKINLFIYSFKRPDTAHAYKVSNEATFQQTAAHLSLILTVGKCCHFVVAIRFTIWSNKCKTGKRKILKYGILVYFRTLTGTEVSKKKGVPRMRIVSCRAL